MDAASTEVHLVDLHVQQFVVVSDGGGVAVEDDQVGVLAP
jgi:hypothetical protein